MKDMGRRHGLANGRADALKGVVAAVKAALALETSALRRLKAG